MRHVRAGRLADSVLRSELASLEPRDRAWTTELVRGTLRLRGRLDHVIAHFSRRPLADLDADVLDALRLGAYQLLEMDGVPAYAAVSQSVDLARSTGGSSLVNAVLRAIRRAEGGIPFPDFETDPMAWLTTRGSHPRWLVERWLDRFGAAATRRLVEMNNERPPLYLRAIGCEPDTARDALAAAGIVANPVHGAPGSLRLAHGADLRLALATVPAIVQDPAASRVADFARPARGTVIDLCAAPGGKAVVMAAGDGTARASRVRVIAVDISWARIRRVVDNFRRLARVTETVVADGTRPPFRPVDAVLVDAPCTGTGTLRRHADARWRIRPADLDALVALQAALLDAAATIVGPEGLLTYATCSIEDEENDWQVDAFLDRNAGFDVERVPGAGGREGDNGAAGGDPGARLRLLPHVDGFDGAFAVRLRRRR